MTADAWEVEPALAATVDAAATTWKQGTVFAGAAIVRYALADLPLTAAAARAGSGPAAVREPLDLSVVISQTCEVVRPCVQRPMVHLAAVVRLTGRTLDEAKRKWRPQYVQVPWAGDDLFADLEVQGIVEKSVLLGANLVAACPDPLAGMRFADGLARHRSRFGFPDDLAPTLEPLVTRFREKAGKDTPQGRRIAEVVAIRATAQPSWNDTPMSVELVFVIEPDRLTPQPSGLDPPQALLDEIAALDAQRLAELLDDREIDPVRRNALWQRLVDAWSARARPTGNVSEVTAHALPANELTFDEARQMPEIDLDYLST